MKRWMIQSMFAAAALVAVAGSGSAQVLNAEIPFPFRAGNVLMLPGAYQVIVGHNAGGSLQFVLSHRDSRKALLLRSDGMKDASRAWRQSGLPKLGFECADGRCALREMWAGDDAPAFRFFAPPRGDGPVQLTEIRLTSTKAD